MATKKRRLKSKTSRDLKQQEPARRKDGTLKPKPKPGKTGTSQGRTGSFKPRPIDSSWITSIRHVSGLLGVTIYDKKRKRNVTYYYTDRDGKHFVALSKAQRQSRSVGKAYWSQNLRSKPFIKRRSASSRTPTK